MTDPQILAISHIERPYANPTKDGATGRTAVGVPVAIVPNDCSMVDLRPFFDAYRHKPERRKGTVHLAPESFINYVQRYYNKETTVMFARRSWLGKYIVTVIFNGHPAGAEDDMTGFGDFMAVTVTRDYKPLEKELNMVAWVGDYADV